MEEGSSRTALCDSTSEATHFYGVLLHSSVNSHAFLSTLRTKEKFSFDHSLHHEHRACVARKPDEKTPQELHCNKILHNAPLCKNILLPFLSSELVGTLDNKEKRKPIEQRQREQQTSAYQIIAPLCYYQTSEIRSDFKIRSSDHSQVDRKISLSHKIQILRFLL